jgi:hypothetical protein
VKTNRTNQAVAGECGRKLVLVPLANNRGTAVIDAADLERILALGISPHWQANPNKRNGRLYVRTTYRGSRNKVPVSRFITGAGDRQCVSYRDGNVFNLRRENLVIGKGYARMGCSAEAVRAELHSIDAPYDPPLSDRALQAQASA